MNEACELLNGDGLRLDQAGAVQVGGLIANTLDGLGLPVEVVDTRVGPTVTTYGLRLGEVQRVKQVPRLYADGRPMLDGRGNVQTVRAIETRSVTANQVISRLKDLQVALGTDSVRVVVPLDADLIGVEAPSSSRPLVPLRAVIETAPMDGSLPVGLGVGDTGAAQSIDLAQMPHLLVAGATGSGKSVWINSMLLSLLVNKTPEELELVLIDPKRVELAPYRDLPHLMRPIVTDASEAAPTLQAVIGEMMGRYQAMEDAGVRNIATYNDNADKPLPYIVVVIDELADLMMTSAKDVEDSLCRLAQMGRATGIHLVVATQRPSVDVITGLIKANFPSRISFAVASATDSRTVLDQSGAEKLLGKGDMLYLPVEASSPLRIQGAMVTDEEIEAVTEWWGKSDYVVSRDERNIVRAANELIYEAAWEFPISVRGYDDEIIEELVRRKIIRPITHKDWLFTYLKDQNPDPPYPETHDSFEEAVKYAWESARKSRLSPYYYTLMCGDPGHGYEFNRSRKRVDEDIIDSREIRYDIIEDLTQNNLKTREYWKNRWKEEPMEPVMPEAPMDGTPMGGEMGEMGELMETVGEFDPDWDPFDPDRPDPFLESLDAELDELPPVEVHNTSAAGMAMGAALGGTAAGTAGAAKAASSKQPAKGGKPAKAAGCGPDCYHSRLGLAASSVPDATKQPASDEYDGPYMGYNTTMPSLEEIKETNRQAEARMKEDALPGQILGWIVAIAVAIFLVFMMALGA